MRSYSYLVMKNLSPVLTPVNGIRTLAAVSISRNLLLNAAVSSSLASPMSVSSILIAILRGSGLHESKFPTISSYAPPNRQVCKPVSLGSQVPSIP